MRFIQVLVGNCDGKRSRGMSMCGWKDNIKMGLKGEKKARIVWTGFVSLRMKS